MFKKFYAKSRTTVPFNGFPSMGVILLEQLRLILNLFHMTTIQMTAAICDLFTSSVQLGPFHWQ